MKKQFVLTAAIVLAGFSVMAQGFVTLTTANNRLFDEFTTPGVGVRSVSTVDFALYWAATGTADPLSAVGSQFGMAAGPANQQVATNGVSQISGASSLNATLTGSGFTLGLVSGGSTVAGGTAGTTGNATFGQFALGGTTAGSTYEMILVTWNASAGFGAMQAGTYNAVGWSNPFNYVTGANATDPNGQTLLSSSGMNQFGTAALAGAVPEPGTMALAGLGGLSLLAFRRKK